VVPSSGSPRFCFGWRDRPEKRRFGQKPGFFVVFDGFWPFWAIFGPHKTVLSADKMVLLVSGSVLSVGTGLLLADKIALPVGERPSLGDGSVLSVGGSLA
jgi:hypothetical protein